jgi:hypothetical protein
MPEFPLDVSQIIQRAKSAVAKPPEPPLTIWQQRWKMARPFVITIAAAGLAKLFAEMVVGKGIKKWEAKRVSRFGSA